MKSIAIHSHQILNKTLSEIKLKNGDKLDSQIEIWEEGKKLWEGVCNVDSTNNYDADDKEKGIQKIEIVDGIYYGIAGMHRDKYKAIIMLNRYPDIADWRKLKQDINIRTFKTIQKNKLHNYKKIAYYINIHYCSDNYDYSEGCITLLKKHFEVFISFFDYNEIMNIEKFRL